MAYRDPERAGRWEDDERRYPYESRFRERHYGYGGRPDYRRENRGFFDRAGDEMRSWFGDEEAQRRRMMDEREDWRERGRGDWGREDWRERGRGDWGRGDWSREPDERAWSRQWGYVEGRGPGYDRERDWDRGYGGYGGGYGAYGGYGYGMGAGYGGYGTWGRERDRDRESRRRGQGVRDFGDYRREDRGLFDRAGDEVRAWFGDEEAQRRRMRDEREWMAGPHAGRGPRNYQRSDERIHEDVCERLARHSYLDPSDIEVRVQNGEVTLSGTVSGRWAKRTAEDIVDDVWGVKEVHNQIRVTQMIPGQEGGERETQGRAGQQQRPSWAA